MNIWRKMEIFLTSLAPLKTAIHRRFNRSVPMLLPGLLLVLAGCTAGEVVVGSAMRAANQIDASQTRSRGNHLLEKHLKMIKDLQAKGDPLGDYWWVVANAKGWVDNPEHDPEKLYAMYQAAAEKGSPDAKVAMGVMLLNGSPTPNATGGGKPLPRDKRDMRRAIELIEQGTRERCWYWEPIVQTISSENCLRPINAAKIVWPEFRDGYLWPKDEALMNYWKVKRDQCEQDPAYRRAEARCR